VNISIMLANNVYLRQTRGLLPRADIIFLDEVFKANSSILNALLSIINERIFYNAGSPWALNLIMLFGASNEPPREEDLGAFFDRFPVRALCDRVPTDQVRDLLDRSHSQEFLDLIPADATEAQKTSLLAAAGSTDPRRQAELLNRRISRCACVNDFRLLQKVMLMTHGGAELDDGQAQTKDFVERFLNMFTQLRNTFDISDRSCGRLFRLARARALLAERTCLEPDDCSVFRYCGKDAETLRRLPAIVEQLK
jgi:MoxR-like ATPase